MRRRDLPSEFQCAYCGELFTAATRDHVIPSCLHGSKRADNPVPVKACAECNTKKSRLDVILRDYLLFDAGSFRSPIAFNVLSNKVVSSAKRRQSRVYQVLQSEGKLEPLFSPAGIYHGEFVKVTSLESEIRLAVTYLVKGLHFYFTKTYLSGDSQFLIRRWFGYEQNRELEQICSHVSDEWFSVGEIFHCRFGIDPIRRDRSTWLLRFYNGILISAVVNGSFSECTDATPER